MTAWAFPGRPALVLAGVFFLLACLVRAPVSVFGFLLPPGVELRNVEGSIWNGKAAAVGFRGMLVQEQAEWHFQPRALLAARLAWAVSGRFEGRESRLNLVLRPGGGELDEVNVFLPLEPLAALHPRLKGVQAGAVLQASAEILRPGAPVRATVSVERLFSRLVPQADLGSFRLDIETDAGGKGNWRIMPVAGSLDISGGGQLDTARSTVSGQVMLTPRGPMPGLTPALSALPKVGAGYQLTF